MMTTNEIMLTRLLHERAKLWKARAEAMTTITRLDEENELDLARIQIIKGDMEERNKQQTALRANLRSYEKMFDDEARSFTASLRDNECGGDIKLCSEASIGNSPET